MAYFIKKHNRFVDALSSGKTKMADCFWILLVRFWILLVHPCFISCYVPHMIWTSIIKFLQRVGTLFNITPFLLYPTDTTLRYTTLCYLEVFTTDGIDAPWWNLHLLFHFINGDTRVISDHRPHLGHFFLRLPLLQVGHNGHHPKVFHIKIAYTN